MSASSVRQSALADWQRANQASLMASLALVAGYLERHARGEAENTDWTDRQDGEVDEPQLDVIVDGDAPNEPTAFDTLCSTFDLSPFERDVLLLCAGIDLDGRFPALCAAAQGDSQRTYPTFGLALAALPNPSWEAISPDAPLRHWRLIEVGTGPSLTASPLRLDERILHYLAGLPGRDERLTGLVEPLRALPYLAGSHRALAERLAATWLEARNDALPVVQLCGEAVAEKRSVAAAVGALLGLEVLVLRSTAIPPSPAEIANLARIWQREVALGNPALLLDCDDADAADPAREAALQQLLDRLDGVVMLTSRERRRPRHRVLVTVDVDKPTRDEQRQVWQDQLGPLAPPLGETVEAIVGQFSVSLPLIVSACAETAGYLAQTEPVEPDELPPDRVAELGRVLWDSCRAQVRVSLDDLAQRLPPAASWDDLVVADTVRQTLANIASQVRWRAQVHETWGFAARGQRGLGIAALFSGASGTGKTLAAEVLARELRLDLYRIDLSAVVSKYIGETEKNLRRIFDAGEEGGAILLFDEADALFGKRSDVKDSHDRYANVEVSYLLQRMESYRGLAILTTNQPEALDTAFLRRLRFVVSFPFPDVAQRTEIWRRVFPAATPTEDLDRPRLARLNVAGGNIRNIAVNAAFEAAAAQSPVRMAHLLRAAQVELAKLGQPLPDLDPRGRP